MTTLSAQNQNNFKASPKEALKSFERANPSGRIPPHSVDAEQALLACCILEGGQESITTCIEGKIRPESFYKPAHQTIFAALSSLYEAGTPVDEVILSEKLSSMGKLEEVGGIPYINDVTNRIDTPAHITHYLNRVKDLYLIRRLIRVSTKTIDEAYTEQDNLEQFIENVEQEIFKISEDRIVDSAQPIKSSIESAVGLVHQMIQNRGALTGVTTGFVDLDKLTSGFHEQEMIVVAGRPSMGKTSIALNMTEAAVLNPDPKKRVGALIFSLEMSAEQIAMRLLCSYARVDMQKLRDGFLDKQAEADLGHAAKALKEAPLWIDDSAFVNILELRAKARRIHAQHKLGIIVVDYLQLISGTDPRIPREQQIAEISRGIKAMAKELNVPVVVGAQLNRESEKEKRQPRLSDLRESGSIEQDADLVLLIAKAKDAQETVDPTSMAELRELILAKQRNGPTGNVQVTFNKRLTRYENYTPINNL